MRLETLTTAPASTAGPSEPKELRTEVKGGKVAFTYHPARAEDETGTPGDRLERSLLSWDLEDEQGNVVPVNADAIHALAPEVKDALVQAIEHPRKAAAALKEAAQPEEEKPRVRAAAEEKKHE